MFPKISIRSFRAAAIFLGLVGAGAEYAHGDLTQGLVAHWCFDDCTANDCGTNNLDGTNSGAACVDSPRIKAFEFKTTDIVHSIPETWDDSIATNQAFTVAAWVKWEGPDPTYSISDQCIIFDGRGSSVGNPGNGMVLYVSGPSNNGRVHVHFNVTNPGGQPDLIGMPIPTQVWTHVAATFDGSADKLRIYVNGQLNAEMTTTAAYTSSNLSAALGTNLWVMPEAVFNGAVDEVRVYDRVLTAQELGELGPFPVPAVSSWGLVVMVLLMLTAGTVVVIKRTQYRPA